MVPSGTGEACSGSVKKADSPPPLNNLDLLLESSPPSAHNLISLDPVPFLSTSPTGVVASRGAVTGGAVTGGEEAPSASSSGGGPCSAEIESQGASSTSSSRTPSARSSKDAAFVGDDADDEFARARRSSRGFRGCVTPAGQAEKRGPRPPAGSSFSSNPKENVVGSESNTSVAASPEMVFDDEDHRTFDLAYTCRNIMKFFSHLHGKRVDLSNYSILQSSVITCCSYLQRCSHKNFSQVSRAARAI